MDIKLPTIRGVERTLWLDMGRVDSYCTSGGLGITVKCEQWGPRNRWILGLIFSTNGWSGIPQLRVLLGMNRSFTIKLNFKWAHHLYHRWWQERWPRNEVKS